MGKNLELKIKVDSFSDFENIAKMIGAERTAVLNQKDVYYNFSIGLLKLRNVNGKYELIKYLRNESGAERWSNYELLYLSGENVEKYLGELFEQEAVVNKIRTLYMYKDTRIHFDEVENLGRFIELEAVVTDSEKEAESQFNFLVEKLNLNLDRQINCSYRDLILKNAAD